MGRAWVLVLLFHVSVAACQAATITVRRDGTGDFVILHEALAAAADGDTVLIGPGEYTEAETIRPAGWSYDIEVYGQILVPRLTIIGAGAGVTVIGPTVRVPRLDSPDGLVTNGPRDSVSLSDLTVRNCYIGLSLNCSLQMERCNVENSLNGLSWTASGAGGTVRDCRFATTDAVYPIGLYVRGVAGVVVEDCEFVRAPPYVDNLAAIFRRCVMTGPYVVGFKSASGVCQLWDCRISDVQVGLATIFVGARCEIHASDIQGSFCAIDAGPRTQVLVVISKLTGGTDSVVYSYGADEISIHESDLVRGSGSVVHCYRNCVTGSVTYDLSGNYWGTSSEDSIREWIIDGNDDGSICATVLYSPFSGQSVPAEATSWGDLKALWR